MRHMRRWRMPRLHRPRMNAPCRFGWVEYDGFQYCHEHFGWRHYVERKNRCDKSPGVHA